MEQSTAQIWVKVYAVLAFIGVALSVLFAIAAFVGSPFLTTLIQGLPGGIVGSFLVFFGFFLLACAIVDLFVGLGLWRHQNWARILTIIFSVIGLFAIFSIVANPLGAIVRVAFSAWTLYLFGFNPAVKALFTSDAKEPAVVAVAPATTASATPTPTAAPAASTTPASAGPAVIEIPVTETAVAAAPAKKAKPAKKAAKKSAKKAPAKKAAKKAPAKKAKK